MMGFSLSNRRHQAGLIVALALIVLPFLNTESGWLAYPLHIIILILIWSLAYTSWSLMGRFGLVSLGHGAFMAMGAYGTALLWNYAGLSPWLGVPISLFLVALVALVIGYPCFRFRIVGHYFALVTLALSEIVRQVIMATRDYTGGSLGFTPHPLEAEASLIERIMALQFPNREVFYFIALAAWAIGLYIWLRVDRSMDRYALEAISEDEDAAAAAGVWVTREKLKITVLSAVMTAAAGALFAQYQMFIAPDTVGGIAISLQIVFAVVAGGIYVMLGPTVGAVITILLAESLRVAIGVKMVGLDNTIYGIMLILFIIFLPKGVLGGLLDFFSRRKQAPTPPPAGRAAEAD
ncbi:MAG: branched-chain amino acid ABC transporter permease [Alphaproteobacteria bacterium]|jgi:branched-chain amino acid transport system permease protein|nr:branched-chain amino acid ABC transporter permease [Alphaproteobacteria bacterium]